MTCLRVESQVTAVSSASCPVVGPVSLSLSKILILSVFNVNSCRKKLEPAEEGSAQYWGKEMSASVARLNGHAEVILNRC